MIHDMSKWEVIREFTQEEIDWMTKHIAEVRHVSTKCPNRKRVICALGVEIYYDTDNPAYRAILLEMLCMAYRMQVKLTALTKEVKDANRLLTEVRGDSGE